MKKLFKLFSLLLATGLFLTLTACTPKDMSAAKEKLEKKEYQVLVIGDYFIATNGEESVTGYLFESKDEAKESVAKIEKLAGESEVKQAGKWLYFGTEQGMKDFD